MNSRRIVRNILLGSFVLETLAPVVSLNEYNKYSNAQKINSLLNFVVKEKSFQFVDLDSDIFLCIGNR
jgi:hypothetical protein